MNSAEKYIILKITNQGVFYNENTFIGWESTNFPSKNEFNFNEREGVFWRAKLLSFDRENSQLNVEIVDYQIFQKEESFISQKAKFGFKKIWFSRLRWLELQKVLNFYVPTSFNEISDSAEQDAIRKNKDEKSVDYSEVTIEGKRLEVSFRHPLMDAKFKMGYVEVEKKLKGVSGTTKIKLFNNNIIPEFDHVKPFFAKALGNKKIEISGIIEVNDNGEVEVKCQSKEISRIDEDLIRAVKRLSLKESIFKPKKISVDKSLFTPEEYFEGFEDQRLGNTLRYNDELIMDEISKLEGVRNRKQLLYLSGKLQSKQIGLRFTLSPEFGFLFYVEGEQMDHFIWELLNTNATYIWSIERSLASLENKFKLIERQVNFIRDNGRIQYLSVEKKEDIIFNKINHDNSESGVVDGFPKWKAKVNEKLV